MPAQSKIVDEAEVREWFEQGRTYQWMTEEYERKYNVTMVPSAWSNWRRRHGLDRRITRDDHLIPWAIKAEHRWHNSLVQLRREARRRAGRDLNPEDERRLDSWIANLKEAGVVVHYDPDTERGFHYVERRKDVDLDLIREPVRRTGKSGD